MPALAPGLSPEFGVGEGTGGTEFDGDDEGVDELPNGTPITAAREDA